MAYNIDTHYKRVALRPDLTTYVTHLTRARPMRKANRFGIMHPVRGEVEATALDVLMEMLESRRINGSGTSGYVIGNRKAACFQDTPIHSLGQMFWQEKLPQGDSHQCPLPHGRER